MCVTWASWAFSMLIIQWPLWPNGYQVEMPHRVFWADRNICVTYIFHFSHKYGSFHKLHPMCKVCGMCWPWYMILYRSECPKCWLVWKTNCIYVNVDLKKFCFQCSSIMKPRYWFSIFFLVNIVHFLFTFLINRKIKIYIFGSVTIYMTWKYSRVHTVHDCTCRLGELYDEKKTNNFANSNKQYWEPIKYF